MHGSRFMGALGAVVCAWVAAGCQIATTPEPGDANAGASADALQAPSTYSAGSQFVPACSRADLGDQRSLEGCFFWHRTKTSGPGACAGGRCSKLVIYFAGGDQACALPGQAYGSDLYGGLAKSYADKGWVFVCANLFTFPFSPAAGKIPYTNEAPRVKALVDAILFSPEVRARWNGEQLLFSGISHGASAPVAAIARHHVDQAPWWRGRKKTAACFLDGQYDVHYNQRFWMAPEHAASCSWFHDRTVCGRYLGADTCPADTNTDGMALDSLVAVAPRPEDKRLPDLTPSDFAIPRWRMIECGSGLAEACGTDPSTFPANPTTGDMLPAAPIVKMCATIGDRCEFGSLPDKTHVECGLSGVADVQCQSWFEGLPADGR